MIYFRNIFLTLVNLLVVLKSSNCSNTIKIEGLGTLIGSTTKSFFNRDTIYQFLGIRYAKAPSGNLRFKAPVPAIPWLGTHNVKQYKRPCPYLPYLNNLTANELSQDVEDCLHLCVYSKKIDPDAMQPVMLFIHGGAFETGSSFQYPPSYLLDKDVVLVVPEYRLGVLGFLSTETDTIPGDAAMLDVILALKWTKTFIKNFGGDPERITVFGHSSGGAMVSALVLSPNVPDNLFQRAIIQSGSFFSTRAFDYHPVESAVAIAKAGCGSAQTISQVNDCLMNMDVKKLLLVSQNVEANGLLNKGLTGFGGAKLTYNSILPMLPHELITQKGAIKNITLMAGNVKDDGSFVLSMLNGWLNYTYGPDFQKMDIFRLYNPIIRFLGIDDETSNTAGFMQNAIFTIEQMIQGNYTVMQRGLVDLVGAITLKAPTYRVARTQAMVYPKQTYLYSYDFHGQFPFLYNMAIFANFDGVNHFSEVIHLFPYTNFGPFTDEEDYRMVKRCVQLWTSFATDGVPKADDVPEWPPLTRITGPYMHIDQNCTIGDNFISEYSVTSKEPIRPPVY